MKLRKYQEEVKNKAIEVLKEYSLVYLAMQTRTGKTLTSMAIVNEMNYKKVLFITKKKVISSVEKDYKLSSFKFKLTVINYESLHKVEGEFDCLIVDEAHTLGQFPVASKRTKLLKQIAFDKPIIFLSATPTPESYSQIFHQFWVSSFSPFGIENKGRRKAFYIFAERYVTKKEMRIGGRTIFDYSHAREDDVKAVIEPFVITLSQKQAGFTQEVKEEILYVDMKASTSKMFKTMLEDNVIIGKKECSTADSPVKLQSKCHQIASGSIIADSGKYLILDKSKAYAINKHSQNKKFCIYYKFKSERDILLSVFEEKITEDAETFQKSKDKIFISQVVSGREGIRLDTADIIYMFNIDFSYLSYEQTRNRVQDFTREKEPLLVWVFSKLGMEEKILKAVKGKKKYTSNYFRRDFL